MTNIYPDPGLKDPANYSFHNTPGTSFSLPALVFDNANGSDIITTGGQLSTDILAAIAASATVNMSVFVSGWSSGSAVASLRSGTLVDLGIAGDGWTTPVSITAGTNNVLALQFRGAGAGPCAFRISPDNTGVAIVIT